MPRTHSPLEYNYRSHKPLTTLFWLIDRPWWYYPYIFIVYGIKHAPELLFPLIVAYVIDQAIAKDYSFITVWNILGVAVLFLQNIPLNFIFNDSVSKTGRHIERQLRSAIARRLQQLSISFHSSSQAGKLQSKILRDVEQIHGASYLILTWITATMINFLFAVVTCWIKQPLMLAFFAVLVPAAVVLHKVFQKHFRKQSHDYRTGIEAMSARVAEMVEMIPISRAHATEGHEVRQVDDRLESVRLVGRKLDRVHALFGAVTWVALQLIRFAALGVMGYMAHIGKISAGDIVAYMFLFSLLEGSVHGILGFMPAFIRAFESVRSVGEVLECPDIEENQGKSKAEFVRGRITFDHVSFRYPEAEDDTIRDFSIDIAPGECVAFVGESGGGKSTLMNLAIGFHRATDGEIRLDGVDMNTLDMRHFRNHIAVVPQRTILFAGTLRDNILYGLDQRISEERLRRIIEAANVAEFVDRLPDGLDSTIGERGAKLSGGQQQRISIARALIRDPRIIVLDEATSALDVISEALVQEAIDRLVADRTTLIVAHRLSTVRKADRIVVMKAGKCIELGTPEELLEAGGEFSRLHNLQQMLL